MLIKRGLTPPVGNVFGQKGRRWLEEIGPSLPAAYRQATASYLRVIDVLTEEILAANGEIERRAEASEEAQWLDSMPGIGPRRPLHPLLPSILPALFRHHTAKKIAGKRPVRSRAPGGHTGDIKKGGAP